MKDKGTLPFTEATVLEIQRLGNTGECYLLIKLKDTVFDTAVGPRPNLARMCG